MGTGHPYGTAGAGQAKPGAKPGKRSEFDLAAGLARREAGIDLVSENAGDFIPDALRAIVRLGKFRGPAEDIREYLEGRGIVPHDTHAWGALTQNLIRIGWFRNTGERVRMRSERSHGRDTAVYELCLDGSPPTPSPAAKAAPAPVATERAPAPAPAAAPAPPPVSWEVGLERLTAEFEREFPDLVTLVGGPKNGVWHCWFRRQDGAAEPVPPKVEAPTMAGALKTGYASARRWATINEARRRMAGA